MVPLESKLQFQSLGSLGKGVRTLLKPGSRQDPGLGAGVAYPSPLPVILTRTICNTRSLGPERCDGEPGEEPFVINPAALPVMPSGPVVACGTRTRRHTVTKISGATRLLRRFMSSTQGKRGIALAHSSVQYASEHAKRAGSMNYCRVRGRQRSEEGEPFKRVRPHTHLPRGCHNADTHGYASVPACALVVVQRHVLASQRDMSLGNSHKLF